MFTLAQYVFGTGRQIENSNNNHNQQQTLDLNPTNQQQQQQLPLSFCFENDNKTNEPTLTNIENDWILIDVNDDHVGYDAQKNAKTKSKKSQTSNQKSSKEEKAQINNVQSNNEHNGKEKSGNLMGNDDVLIEQPTMNVFDNLFVKKPPPPAPVETTPTISNVVIAKSLSTMNKAEQRKLILSKIQQSSSKNNKKADNSGSNNQNNNNKENQSSNNNTKTNKKMKKTKSQRNAETMVINHVPTATIPATSSSSPLAINGSINKKAFTAIVAKDKCLRKVNISKKRNERQNKVAINRNGPMIRQKKMFIHINGILNNRKNC